MSAPKLLDFLTGVMRQSPARASSFLSTLDDATAARLLASAEAGDTRQILKAMSEQTWGLSPARPTPEVQVQPAGRSPMSFEDRVLNDPNIRRAVDASGAQVPAGDVEALLGAYRGAAPKRGRPPRGGDPVAESIRELSRPVDQVAAEGIAAQFDRATTRQPASTVGYEHAGAKNFSPDGPHADGGGLQIQRQMQDEYDAIAAPAASAPSRQMELPLGDEPTGMIPYGARGPGVPVGGVRGPGVLQDSPRAAGGNPLFDTPDIPASAVEKLQRYMDDIGSGPAPEESSFAFGSAPAMGPGDRARFHWQNLRGNWADDMPIDEVPPRPAKPRPAAPRERVGMSGRDLATAAGVGLAIGGATDLALNAIDSEGSSPEDLVEESRPAPVVEATASRPEPTVVQAPQDYSLQARALINRLNDMRRAAGGEVPEAPAMMAEINRLVAMGNQQRRDPGYSYQQADPARDPYQQARDLIAQVNQMYRQGMTPNSPEVQRIMAQVRQLQAQGDAIRNRRAG